MTQRAVIEAFGEATLEGDSERLVALLHPDAVLTTDGGGHVTAAREPIVASDRVARTVRALSKRGDKLRMP